MMQRAYALLDVKTVQDDQRVVEGVASTPTLDRMGDIVEPLGAKFSVPMPLLWQHRADSPVGHVEFAKATAAGIPFRARIAKIAEPGPLQTMCDMAWQAVKARLVAAVSIGFAINAYENMKEGGWKITDWEWLELSLVTIPANAEATINTIKSIDAEWLAASGRAPSGARRSPAGATASKATVVHAQEGKPMSKTIAEQIAAFETTRAAKAARRDEIQAKVGDEGRTKDAAEREEFDTLADEIKAIDAELVDLRALEKANKAAAVTIENVADPAAASATRGKIAGTVVAQRKLLEGLGFTRYVLALTRARGNIMMAAEIAKSNEQWMAETPDVATVLRAAVGAGSTTDSTWAGPLVQYQNLASEFIEYLRPLTIIGRLPGLRYVPFKVKIPRQTGTSTAGWVGEGQAKPVSALAFDSVTLDITTISDIVVFTQQLAQLSQPSVERLVRDDLAAKVVNFMDAQFVDPSVSSTGSSPASITNGVSPTVASGTTLDAMRTDIGNLVEGFLEANLQLNSPCWIMSQVTAAKINLVRNSLGIKEYPEINMNGGILEGVPVITSQSVPATGGSPVDGYPMILVNCGDILIADDGQVRIDASAEASLQMDSAPDSPTTASTTLISLWQQGMLAIKADRDINWVKRRSTAVAYISSAKYTTG